VAEAIRLGNRAESGQPGSPLPSLPTSRKKLLRQSPQRRPTVLEREANIIADLPRIYGKPEEYRSYQSDPNNDIQPVSKISINLGRPGPGEPFRVLVAGAAPISHALAAQKGDIPLHTARHRAPGELAIRLAVALAVQDVRAQRGGIELRGDGRQALIIDGRGHHLALRAVKPLAQPDVIHVIIFHARREQLADDLGERQRAVQRPARRFENQF